MGTPNRMIRMSDEHWNALAAIAETLVPDSEVTRYTSPGTSRILPMWRMVADGKLVVVRPEDVKPRDE